MFRIRRRWFLIALLAVAVVALSAALSGASHLPSQITLVLDDTTQEFSYGDFTQTIETGKAECKLTADSLSGTNNSDHPEGSLIVFSATTYDNAGRPVVGNVGLVEDGLGVNQKGHGNAQECGRTDELGDIDADGNPTTETLTLVLGDAIGDQMIRSAVLDIEAKFAAEMRIDFLRRDESSLSGYTSFDHKIIVIGGGSDSGPDSKFRDKQSIPVSSSLGLFDGITISMRSGGVSLEGGATWEYSEESPDEHRTVFNLEDASASLSIDATTEGGDGNVLAAGSSITWSYRVTNTGDLELSGLTVVDTPLGAATCLVTTLASGASTTCTIVGHAQVGDFSNIATASATSPFGKKVEDTDGSSYFGSDPKIQIVSETNGPGELPSDGPYIEVDDTVTWTYTVTNIGNIELENVVVTDDPLGTISGPDSGDTNDDGKLQSTETWVYTASDSDPGATAGAYANIGFAVATDSIATPTPLASDGSSYFGSNPSVSIVATNNGPPIITGTSVTWSFSVTNTGNVPLDFVVVTEGGDTVGTCALGTVAIGATVTCTYDEEASFGENTPVFKVQGIGPNSVVVGETALPVSYYGSLGCGDGYVDGGPDLAGDTPLAAFVLGPQTKESPCIAPIVITSSNDGTTQTVSVGPPAGSLWTGVTGIVTIEWDAETPLTEDIPRTVQVLPGDDVVIPWCAEVVGVSQATDGGGEPLWYYGLDPATEIYPTATGGGDTCLISQWTATVDDGVVKTQTVEIFYIWNDPIFAR